MKVEKEEGWKRKKEEGVFALSNILGDCRRMFLPAKHGTESKATTLPGPSSAKQCECENRVILIVPVIYFEHYGLS